MPNSVGDTITAYGYSRKLLNCCPQVVIDLDIGHPHPPIRPIGWVDIIIFVSPIRPNGIGIAIGVCRNGGVSGTCKRGSVGNLAVWSPVSTFWAVGKEDVIVAITWITSNSNFRISSLWVWGFYFIVFLGLCCNLLKYIKIKLLDSHFCLW